jgi:hypothetical protein
MLLLKEGEGKVHLTRVAVPSGLGLAETKMSMTSDLGPPPSILSGTG